jgi:hypothetical protein
MVLPSYIIEQIIRRERERGRPQPVRQPQLEIDDWVETPDEDQPRPPNDNPRGILEVDIGNKKDN